MSLPCHCHCCVENDQCQSFPISSWVKLYGMCILPSCLFFFLEYVSSGAGQLMPMHHRSKSYLLLILSVAASWKVETKNGFLSEV